MNLSYILYKIYIYMDIYIHTGVYMYEKSLERSISDISSVSLWVLRIQIFLLSSLQTSVFFVLKSQLTEILNQHENSKAIPFRKRMKTYIEFWLLICQVSLTFNRKKVIFFF